jgi:uncharacterized protein YbbC (DUF1343 family)
MLKEIDVLIIDLQDLGIRCYTYVSTLVLALDAAAAQEIPVIVTDRPIPFSDTPAGPMLDPELQSFVGQINAPFIYAMTPAETARWYQATACPKLELSAIKADIKGKSLRSAFFHRQPCPPPSPALPSRDSILCYPSTVFFEAFSHISHGRGTPLPFQVIGADWLDGAALAESLNKLSIQGMQAYPHLMTSKQPEKPIVGVRLHLTDPSTFAPVPAALAMLQAIHKMAPDNLWDQDQARPDFLDKLAGARSFRETIQNEQPSQLMLARWKQECEPFAAARAAALLYSRNTEAPA